MKFPSAAGVPGDGGLGIRIAEIPNEVHGQPFAGAYIVFKLAPSKTYSEKIAVSNSTGAPMTVSLFPKSATYTNGIFQPLEKVVPNGLADWTSVSPKIAKLPPHTEVIATVTIKVPANATAGQQYGIVWASTGTFPNSNAIGGVSRVGIRMYDQIGDGGTGTPSPSTSTAVDNTPGPGSHSVEFIWLGLSLLLISIIIIGGIAVRREQKKAEKRRKKKRSS